MRTEMQDSIAERTPPKTDIHSFEIGRWGEEWVVRTHLKQEYAHLFGANALVELGSGFKVITPEGSLEVTWLNAEAEQHKPFDILVRGGDSEQFIEVKSSSTDTIEWFEVSGNQWKLAAAEGPRFLIYRVYRAGSTQPRLTIIDDLITRWSRQELDANPIRIKL
jgi:hypothetical protein